MKLAVAFACHLDNNEFPQAEEMMAKNCVYKFRDQTIVGSDNIIECYQGSFDSVADQLDEIIFESQVEELSQQLFKMHFTDRISKNGNNLEHRCEQIIRFYEGKIVEIQHIDLDGEIEKLNTFFSKNGIVRKK